MGEPSCPDLVEVMRRVLGPSEPELTCDECFAQLDAYVELELDGADADLAVPGMGAHLEGCPACGEEHASLRALASESALTTFVDEEPP